MALFGKLFEKKYCSVCGTELGVFGKTKLADGLLCKECAGKLSPYFTGARQATVDQIKEQLAYREQNKQAVAAFAPTRTLGNDTKVYIDEDDCKVVVTRASNWRSVNPDVFNYDQITGCNYDVDESRDEVTYKDKEGNTKSYNPPRYEYEYDFYITIFINHPYVSKIRFKLNQNTIERKGSVEYMSAENLAKEICDALTQVRQGVRDAKAPKTAMQCPHCMATTVPDENGCCEYCGGALI
ncbi:MAG: DUF4428 domain-containing protein [Coriobacteriales bacterium]|nr:DUF4428 domain-containing protein [Coriobacteriales bacterium]